ncbi:hypothetical protein GW17_00021506 [Ensete ventricosum]|nr:hypothetical protein GW17_00021506 [Ensete ventricosum]
MQSSHTARGFELQDLVAGRHHTVIGGTQALERVAGEGSGTKSRALIERDENSDTIIDMSQLSLNVLQLRTEVSVGRVFDGWHEGAITFSPTYKYYPNSDEYYGCIQRKKGEKRRVPAWCDRILWHGNGIKQKLYDRCESKLSDHRPVRSIFGVEVEVVTSLTSLRSF